MLGQYDEAENRLKFASSNSADNAELMALVGLSRLRAGNTLAGIQELEKAAAASPSDVVVRSELARAYMATGETDRAIKQLLEHKGLAKLAAVEVLEAGREPLHRALVGIRVLDRLDQDPIIVVDSIRSWRSLIDCDNFPPRPTWSSKPSSRSRCCW